MRVEDLDRLERQIKDAQEAKARAEGSRASLLDRLREEYSVGSIEEAQDLIRRLEQEMGERKAKLQSLLDEIAEKMP